MAIAQYVGANPLYKNNVTIASTVDIESEVLVDGIASGLHCVTVFPLLRMYKLAFSQAVYKSFVNLTIEQLTSKYL